MKEEKMKVGDCVALKSGGPIMTVQQVGHNVNNARAFQCSWFDGDKLKEGDFAPESLKPEEPSFCCDLL